eukprot:jgi/Mesvir1/23769/Mv06222-RA.1
MEDVAVAASHDELAMLRLQNEMLQLRLATMEEGGGDQMGESMSGSSSDAEDEGEEGRGTRSGAPQGEGSALDRMPGHRRAEHRDKRQVDKDYFASYSMFGIHREMLSDKPRTSAYQSAILGNPQLFAGAVVLDVGCGTGILSLFSAKAGAARVIGIDGSDRMAGVARQVAAKNGLLREPATEGVAPAGGSGVVEIVAGKVEEVALPLARRSADVLVSEWMGYCLLYESMLDSVLHARDTWLKPGGAILPDIFTVHMAGYGRGATPLPFWDDVYGFNMSTIGGMALEEGLDTAVVAHVEGQHLVTPTLQIKAFDLCSMSAADVGFSHEFRLTAQTPPSASAEPSTLSGTTKHCSMPAESLACYGVVIWFDSHFSERFCPTVPMVLSTSPHAPPTHWAQTLLTFKEPVVLAPARNDNTSDAVVAIEGRISIARSSVNYRSIDVSLEHCTVRQDGSRGKATTSLYDM